MTVYPSELLRGNLLYFHFFYKRAYYKSKVYQSKFTERKVTMAIMNEKENKAFPGLYDAGLISLPTVSSIMQQGELSIEDGKQTYHADRQSEEIIYNCLATDINPKTGKTETMLVQLTEDGKFEKHNTMDVYDLKTDLRPILSFDRSLEEYGFKKGDIAYDPKCPNLGEWLVISDTEMISCNKDVFGQVSILGTNEDVLDRATEYFQTTFISEQKFGQQEYEYNKVTETLQSNDEIYISEKEKEEVLADVQAGKELSEKAANLGAATYVTDKVINTDIEFANEFESHASKLSDIVKGIGAKVKDFFVKEEVINTNDIIAKGVSAETAYAIHDEAELRTESRFSLKKFGEYCRDKIKDLKERGVYALAGIGKKMSELKIDHYERLQAKEQEHIKAAMARIKEYSKDEGNVKAAEQRVKAFIKNAGRSISNVGITIANTAKFVTSGNLAKAVTKGEIEFDPTPYHPMIEGKDVRVTRSSYYTSLYKSEDNRIIDSALHLGQIKAKLFHERLAAVPMAEREQTADTLLGQMAESIGSASLMDRKIEYNTIEYGFPTKYVPHVMEFTQEGLVIDGQNMRDVDYEGMSKLMSPNSIMHLFVESEKESIVAMYERAELDIPDLVQELDNENVRKSYNIGNSYDQNENMVNNMSEIHKEAFEADGLLKGGYTFADKLAEKEEEGIGI